MSAVRQRETAKYVFPEELNAINITFKEGEQEQSPRFGLLPTGVAVNRVLIAGTLTEWEITNPDSPDPNYYHARVVDFRGDTAHIYTGQYQETATQALQQIDPPAHVMVIGKPNVYKNDSGEAYTSVTPEYIVERSASVRYHWTLAAAEQTADRITQFKNNPDGKYVAWAADVFGDLTDPIRDVAVQNLKEARRFKREGGLE